MRTIAIIGAGQTGLLLGHALLRAGYSVRLFSDRSPDAFLNQTRPTGTAVRFGTALAWERQLGLNHWDDVAASGDGIYMTFWPGSPAYPFLTMLGRLSQPFRAIDVRLQSHRWMHDLVERGGALEIENVTIDRLETIAAEHDLTVVAAGRGAIRDLFPRDSQRSRYTEPQRHLAMVNFVGPGPSFPGSPFVPVKFNFFARYGECFWVPWYQKDGIQAWSMLFEAKADGPLDRFRNARSGQEILDIAKRVVRDMMPRDYDFVKDAELVDEHAWQGGAFVPEVRKAVGELPSGRLVMSLGDTNHSLDPIGGQGANNGNKMARNLARCIAERGERPFDRAWMNATYERFWSRHHFTDTFNNTLLEPLTPAGLQILIATYGSTGLAHDRNPNQTAANAFVENFDDPALVTAALRDNRQARIWIRRQTGHYVRTLARGAGRLALAQLRMRLGFSPGHPGMA